MIAHALAMEVKMYSSGAARHHRKGNRPAIWSSYPVVGSPAPRWPTYWPSRRRRLHLL